MQERAACVQGAERGGEGGDGVDVKRGGGGRKGRDCADAVRAGGEWRTQKRWGDTALKAVEDARAGGIRAGGGAGRGRRWKWCGSGS
eukprot:363610-Chlamydomonas_euryale.AAC.3